MIFKILILYIIVTIAWMLLEKIIYGQTQPRLVDDVIAIVLSISLYYNFN
ncbi:hypothetical protein SAMN05421839_10623 [Halolactibacillus halophilus]|uniref:Uncharacterized protein n=1 Tax=Halolactibacillus halophilus TaxID=306540 RepID=A0A1I5MMV5_9BACI|nr:hypothetical protein HHA03_20470 [Halolactibacillus halophilus]SFP10860.1 hypothetical protein SAMN05421839_10623 [Halolactibacillus halophilus]